MRAGLLDRAERLFSELIESDAHTPAALRSLLEIYQQEKDWEKSLEQAVITSYSIHYTKLYDMPQPWQPPPN